MGFAASARLGDALPQRQIFRRSTKTEDPRFAYINRSKKLFGVRELTGNEAKILGCIMMRVEWRSGEVVLSYTAISKIVGLVPRSVIRIVERLRAKGWLEIEATAGGRNKENRYCARAALQKLGGFPVTASRDSLSCAATQIEPKTSTAVEVLSSTSSLSSTMEEETNTGAARDAAEPQSVSEIRTPEEVDSPFQTTKAQRPGVAKVESLAARRVLDQWFKVVHRELAKSGKTAAAFPQRVAAIEARLVDGFAVEDLFDVVDGALTVRWVRENPHALAPELLFGGKNFELYMARGAEQREARERARKRDELAAAHREVARLPNVATPAAADELAAIGGVFAVLDAVGT